MTPRAALIGNPSVGKSLIFNHLTGLGVEVSNYPGTTVGVMHGVVRYGDAEFSLADLPGIYSLSGDSIEEEMVREYLLAEDLDLLIAVLDAKHLERNLYLLLQVAEIKKPLLVILNMMDEAETAGKIIDSASLAKQLGVPVIPSVATSGKNLDDIARAVLDGNVPVPALAIPYDHHIEAAVHSLQKYYGLSQPEALWALASVSVSTITPEIHENALVISEEIERRHMMSPEQIIAANRHNLAKQLATSVTSTAPPRRRRDFDALLTRGFPGLPILAFIMVSILLIVFTLGGVLEETIVSLMTTYIADPFHALGLDPFADTLGGAIILALMSGLGIAFPYVFLFYLFISVLEDTGYLTRAAFLADRGMHKLGLHGQGLIPMVLSFGCSVPAIMSTRLLPTRRERVIASVLVTMLPCSARTVVISGIVASFIGFGAAFSIYAIVFVLVFVVGCILSRITPGEQYGMILEMAELRRPIASHVVRKAWMRVREFIYIAMPLLLVSSIFLGLFEYYGLVAMFEEFIDPISTAVLGLPGFAFTALMFGILRKEMAFETLAVMAGTTDLATVLSSGQLYIFALVCALFIPCISTIAVLMRETGVRYAAMITVFTLCLGIGLGALAHLILL
ncbi:ferrous iron transport protein B [Methanocorpusculum vombati]|uniref:Ferrous iron transport protein B n=1 Tax=Methanocorpusculum vombati TaxID=3002864 RepID=A0ABT4IMF7_9EURY|nr:ferrous iron transport protein B [Methanocorpusculum vombati]MCZ9319674.1 ferrous iron transport protein B [Methanocorpusculum sp.]MCZ0862940.1 ferrous iron transport protein B [Methanocorpusculum vombati]MDE2520917.1 ferrous iron transport protein B [Methanocorpusculum sp.]MDE2533640.1 ferrous iron transport protein B [Methanocorpusculum sp.]MDE2546328.1 ferrous iron transport protein B [Methanocorpusculum sp.]